MRAAQTAATRPSAVRAGTTLAAGTSPSNTTVATDRPRPKPPPIRKRNATCASRYSAIPAHRPSGGTIRSGSFTSWSVVSKPNANRTIPATIGRCRYEYASLASATRDAPVALGQRCLGDEDDPVEIRPPEARDHGDPQQGGRDYAGFERKPCRAEPDRHDRFAERDDDDQPETFDEVRR